MTLTIQQFGEIYGRTTPGPQPGANATVGEWLSWDQDRAAAAFSADQYQRYLANPGGFQMQPWIIGSRWDASSGGFPVTYVAPTSVAGIQIAGASQENLAVLARTPLSEILAPKAGVANGLPILPIAIGVGLLWWGLSE